MKKIVLHSIALGSLLFASVPVMATGFVTLPTTGVAVPGGTSAYLTCNITGDFGSAVNGSTPPTFSPNGGANNTCAVPSNNPPIAGYLQTASTVRNIVMTNAFTNNQAITVGTVTDQVWRSGTNCVYASRIRLNNVDYDRRAASPGTQYFEINDFRRAGFLNRGPVSVAYNFVTRGGAQSDEVLYRAGLTATSVPHPVGASAQPLTSVAPISLNWVDFTSDVNFLDPDGSSTRDSSWFYVKSTCTVDAPSAVTGALRFKQTGQEGQPIIEVSVPGYAPTGATTAP